MSQSDEVRVKLGLTYRDKISGRTGVATGRYEFLYGCIRINLEGELKEGQKHGDNELVVDEQRCELVSDAKPIERGELVGQPGGPRDQSTGRRSDPKR